MTRTQKSLVTSAVLVLAAGGLAAWVLLGVKAPAEREAQREEEAKKAFSFEKNQVKRLSLAARGETTVVERDEGEGWRIVSPVSARADVVPVDAIVAKLSEFKGREAVADDHANLGEYGLDVPRIEAALTLEDGAELRLKIGAENPFDQSIYFTKGGDDRVFLAEPGLTHPLDKSLFELRDKRLLPGNPEVASFEVRTPTSYFTVEQDDGGWKLVAPMQDRADRQTVDEVLARLRSLQAKAFVEEEVPSDAGKLRRYGLELPVVAVALTLGADAAPRTLFVGEVQTSGGKKAYAYFSDGGPLMEVDTGLADDLAKPLAELRDRMVASFDRDSVRRLEIETEGGAPIVVRVGRDEPGLNGYQRDVFEIEGSARKPRMWKLSGALQALAALKGVVIAAESAKDLGRYGLEKPRVVYAVFDEDGAELSRVLVGGSRGERVYVAKAGSRRVLEVEKDTVDDLPRALEDIVEPDSSASAAAPGAPAEVGE